jgi:hypothetical protein
LEAEKPKDLSSIAKIGALGLYSLTPFCTIFQETRGGQIYLVEETGVPRENSDLLIVRDKLYHNFNGDSH